MADDAQSLSKRELERQNLALQERIFELDAQNRILTARRNTYTVSDIITQAFRYGTICFIALCVYWSVTALAGKDTDIGVFLYTFFSGHISTALAWLLSVAAAIWARGERRLRKRKVQELARRNEQLELLLDEKRTSSQLTD